MRLEKRRVLVVGASSGIGLASARAIGAEGARVALAARREERLRETVAELGDGAVAIHCDVQDEASCESVVAEAVASFGGLDAIVYAPGTGLFKPLAEIDGADWRFVLETNVIGASLVMRAALPHLRKTRGNAVFLGSICIDDAPPRPSFAPYVVSKVALESLVRAWQGEYPEIAFTSIAIGDTLSEYGTQAPAEELGPIVHRWVREGYMYGRVMQPESVAEQVVNVLASIEAVRRIAITPRYAEEPSAGVEIYERRGSS